MTHLVTGIKPSRSDAERNGPVQQEFDDDVKARLCADTFVRDGYTQVKLWSFVGAPVLKKVVEWTDAL